MKFTEKQANMPIEILYNDHYVGMPIMVLSSGATPDSDGKKIVKAGTIWPTNGINAKGVILHDADVTHGDAPGTIIVHGFIDNAKLIKNGITVSEEAKTALKLINFI